MPDIRCAQGTIAYREHGSGSPALLIHGVMVDGRVWDRMVMNLGSQARCIMPDLPLGAHRTPMESQADLSPTGLASLIAELIERLELSDVTLVGNDTGGALCQLVAAHHPERIGRLVLTNCDAFENFPPRSLRPLIAFLGRVPGALAALGNLGRLRAMRRATTSLAPLTVEPVPDDLLEQWIAPLREQAIRRDLQRVLRAISPSYTVQAARQLERFDRPALIAWGTEDRFFSMSDAERLAATMPHARLEKLWGARTFVQMDVPERLAELVAEFVAAPRDAPEPPVGR